MERFLFLAETEVNAAVVVLNFLLVATLLLILLYVYAKTHSALSYTRSSFAALVIIGTVASMIMMIVNQNLFGAFAFFIVFTFIRFRSVMKETRDAVFFLLALVIGIAVGRGAYLVAVSGTITLSLLILLLQRFGITLPRARERILMVITSHTPFSLETQPHAAPYIQSFRTLRAHERSDGTHRYVMDIVMHKPSALAKLVDTLRIQDGVDTVEVMNEQRGVTY